MTNHPLSHEKDSQKIKRFFPLMPLFWLACAAALGIAITKFFSYPLAWIFLAAVITGALSFHSRLRSWGILFMTFFTFWFYTQAKTSHIPKNDLRNIIENHHQTITAEGMVSQNPVYKSKNKFPWEFTFEIQKIFTDKGEFPVQGKILIYAASEKEIRYGDILHWTGFISHPTPPENPGQFDFEKFLSHRGIFYTARVPEENLEILDRNHGSWIEKITAKLREHMLKISQIPPYWHPQKISSMQLSSDQEISALMSAMLWGYKNELKEDTKNAFQKTGTLHLFAVSGQNVAALTGLLILILEMLGFLRWRWSWTLIPIIFIFCLTTGMQPSAARAFVMISIIFIGWLIYRPAQPFNLLGASALLLWIWEPLQLFDVGFQLSFACVASLLILTTPLTNLFSKIYRPDPWIPRRLISPQQNFLYSSYRFCCAIFAVSIAAWIGALPFTLYYFHSFTPITPIANICIAIPANFVVILCVLSVSTGLIWTGFSIFFNQINWILLQGIMLMINLLVQIPHGHFYVPTHPQDIFLKNTKITVLKTDNAAPLLIETPRKKWLVNTGNEKHWKFTIAPLRQKKGINQWNGVIITQSAKSHMGGIHKMMEEMPSKFYAAPNFIGQSKFFQNWLTEMQRQKIPLTFLKQSDALALSEKIKMNILWPQEKALSKRAQENSLVFTLQLGKFKILYAGDIPENVEHEILKQPPENLQAHILIQSPNSKEKNLSNPWIKTIAPAYIIRPSPPYGADLSLDDDFWKLTQALSITFLDMKETGAIEIDIQKNNLLVRTFR